MRKLLLLLSLVLLQPLRAAAQPPPSAPAGSRTVEVDPIRCWWRTSTGAVRIGEQFDVDLTCAVLETDAVSVMVDESRLGNAVIQMAPFEVVGGSHPADLHEGLRRFFQYHYTLRIINPDVIGKDVGLPYLSLHYRINSRVAAGGAAVQGRDLEYVLPEAGVRVLSMVPVGVSDIRAGAGAPFEAVDALLFRANLLRIVATALFALGGIVVLLVLIRVARGSLFSRTPRSQRTLSPGALVKVATGELRRVARARATDGWTPALIDRALGATRIIAAAALGDPISQRTVDRDTALGEGRVLAAGPRLGTRRLVSAPTTAHDVARRAARATPGTPAHGRLDALREALSSLTGAQYGRAQAIDDLALDEALSRATDTGRAVARRLSFPFTLVARLRSSERAGALD